MLVALKQIENIEAIDELFWTLFGRNRFKKLWENYIINSSLFFREKKYEKTPIY